MLVDGSLAGIGVRESVADVARVLGRQASAIVWRTFAQADLEEMAAHAGVPVVNALTDDFHPCQLLADLLTIREHKGELAGLTVAFLGDGACNMGNSWLLAGATAGMHVRVSAPERLHARRRRSLADASAIAATTGGSALLEPDPHAAVAGADVVVTDTWVSMGKEDEAAERAEVFGAWSLDRRAASPQADDDAIAAALPAGLPRQGDRRRGPRRPAQRGLGRGREPAARPEGDPRLAARGGAG